MTALIPALSRSVFTSVSMPRSLKIATAAGESLSEMRTFGMAKLLERWAPSAFAGARGSQKPAGSQRHLDTHSRKEAEGENDGEVRHGDRLQMPALCIAEEGVPQQEAQANDRHQKIDRARPATHVQ